MILRMTKENPTRMLRIGLAALLAGNSLQMALHWSHGRHDGLIGLALGVCYGISFPLLILYGRHKNKINR